MSCRSAGRVAGSCHQPHGSDTPAMLLGSEIHPPFEDGSCEGCHRRPRGTKLRPVHRGDRSVFCLSLRPRRRVREWARCTLQSGKGAASSVINRTWRNEKALLKTSGPELCFSCHRDVEDLVKGSGAHAAAAEDCATCHDPHRSAEPFLAHGRDARAVPHVPRSRPESDQYSPGRRHGDGKLRRVPRSARFLVEIAARVRLGPCLFRGHVVLDATWDRLLN